MRVLAVALLALLVAVPASAQRARVDDDPQHVICDSGCGSGATDVEDNDIAAGQAIPPAIGLNYYYNSDVGTWNRVADNSRLPVRANIDNTVTVAFGSVGTGNATLDSLNDAVSMDITGLQTVGFWLQAGSFAGTITFEGSVDNTIWEPVTFARHDQTNGLRHVTSIALTNPNEAVFGTFIVGAPFRYVRAVVSAFTSGTTYGAIEGTAIQSPFADNLAAALDNGFAPKAILIGGGLTSSTPHSFQMRNAAPAGADYGLVVRQAGSLDIATLPANATQNQTQWNGTTVDTNSGNKSAGTLRVVLATDQPALTNKLLVTPDSVALPANQSVNVAQVAGTATSVNSGTKDAGTLRVVLATDQPALTNKLLVTPDSVALPANQSVNVSQFGGTNVVVGLGAGGSGVPRVTLSNDSSLAANQSVNVAQIGGAAVVTVASGVQKVGVVGNAGAVFDAPNAGTMPANALAAGMQTATIDTSPTAVTAGNLRYQLASTEGVTYVQEGGPKRFSCFVQGVTVTTQCQAAPAAGLRAYITSVAMSNQAATVQTLDVIFGTGANCATAPAALTHKWQFGTVATTTSPFAVDVTFPTPLVPTAANAICVRPSAATAFGATITGFIAP